MEDEHTVGELDALRTAGVLKAPRVLAARTHGAKKRPSCQKKGHMMPRSKHCDKHDEWLAQQAQKKNTTAAATAPAAMPAVAADETTAAADTNVDTDSPAGEQQETDSPAGEKQETDADLCDVHDGMPSEDGCEDDGNDEEFCGACTSVDQFELDDKENRGNWC